MIAKQRRQIYTCEIYDESHDELDILVLRTPWDADPSDLGRYCGLWTGKIVVSTVYPTYEPRRSRTATVLVRRGLRADGWTIMDAVVHNRPTEELLVVFGERRWTRPAPIPRPYGLTWTRCSRSLADDDAGGVLACS